MKIIPAEHRYRDEWLRMRTVLWPECGPEESYEEISAILAGSREVAFVAVDDHDHVMGFIEVSTRDYVDGCRTSPVGFVEGIYVDEPHRQSGIASALIRHAEQWAASRGCTELGSDAYIDDTRSIAFHKATGFREVERQVVFLKSIDRETRGAE